jgi:HK97 family phage prohead protease
MPAIKKTPRPEIRRMRPASPLEIRATNTGKSITGYFATFDQLSEDLGGFRERIAPGAFSDSLRRLAVKSFVDHDPTKLLGSTAAGTLETKEDETGLRFKVSIPNTSYATDLVTLLQRGDAPGECSFGFNTAGPDGDSWDMEGDTLVRTLHRVTLYEGSILTGNDPAYPGTSAGLRSRKPCLGNCPIDLRSKLNLRDYDDDDSPYDDDPDSDECQEWLDDRDLPTADEDDTPCDCDCEECGQGNHRDCTRDKGERCELKRDKSRKSFVGWFRPDDIMGSPRSRARILETTVQAQRELLLRRMR